MTIFLVRHAQAGARRDHDGPDEDRPLTAEGRHQAADLAGVLADLGATSVLTSPYRRAYQTAVPLAAHLAVEVQIHHGLAEGPADDALVLIRELAGTGAALFSHGDVIPESLDVLHREDRLKLGRDPRCQKGSIWMLELDDEGSRFVKATYIPPQQWAKR